MSVSGKAVGREVSVDGDGDDDVYEDDSDFEYLNVPGYEYTDGPVDPQPGPASEATPLCAHQSDLVMPFSSIHQPALPYDSDDRVCFIVGCRVNVEITDVERTEHHVLNPNLYTIKVAHSDFSWIIKKRYKHFRSLHDQLILFRAKLHLPVPTRRHRMRRQSFKQRRESLPRFPRRPEMMVSEEEMGDRKKQLTTYLQRILRIPPLRNHHETLKFFEVSHLSFVNGLGAKYHEGLIKKRSGGRSLTGCCPCCGQFIGNITAHYNKRYLVLKDTFLAYVNPHHGTVSDVLLMDGHFDIQCGILNTGVRHGLQITTLNRQLILKGWTSRSADEWKDAILQVADTIAKDFTTPNRYESFAPQRPNAHAQWFVDGAGYMSACADAMEAAKEEIFITDWWLSPEIYMKRPMTEGERWRLDIILKRKACEGVKIFIILFKEVEMALGINSFYTKAALLKLHPTNIKVLRHPDVVNSGVLLWSHHEKMVVIDQRIAFLGGIDLCYGRYDTPEHRLTDLGSVLASPDLFDPLHVPDKERSSTINRTPHFALPSPEIPAYDRSISSHSWPETEADRAQLGLSHRDESTASRYHKEHLHKQLTTISEVSLQGVVPEITLKGIDNTETDTEKLLTKGAVDGDVTVNCDGVNTVRTSPPEITVQHGSPPSAVILDGGVKGNDAVISPLGSPASILSSLPKTAIDEDPDQSLPHLHNMKVPNDHNLTRQLSTESGHVNHAAVFTPTHESRTFTSSAENGSSHVEVEVIVPEMNLRLAAPPKSVRVVTPDATNNNVEGPNGKNETTSATVSSGWKKLRAVLYLQRWQKREVPDGAGAKKEKRKRPPNLQLTRQDCLDHGNADFLNLPPGAIKPTTPKPRKKIVQKAHDIKIDFKERFRKKQSKSVDVAGDTEFDFSFYKTLSDQGGPEGILEDLGLEGSSKIWIGKDYVNFISKDFVELDKPFTDFIDRTKTPRMPWHDIGAVVYGKPARDVARHFIQRWNFAKVQKRKTNMGYPLLLPKCYTKVTVPRGALASSIPCKVQVLRSASTWSAGIATADQSIHNAYVDLIRKAEHFIYIENQFFISILDEDNKITENKIADTLYSRIIEAHKVGAVFRVYVVMPLLPAFEGELGTTSGGAIQAIQHWNYSSICRGGKSLLQRLSLEIPDPSEYISFFGLRNHGELGSVITTELVYVHSKLMIVDDRFVIIGSANINDRSLLGTRDSELAIITEDTHMRKSRMNGQDYEAGWFASGLRQSLFREHLGVSLVDPEVNIIDPVIESFYCDEWIAQTAINTKVYDEVFRCIPTDNVTTFCEISEYQAGIKLAETNPTEARQKLKKVKGHLVQFPLNFLSDVKVEPNVTTKEGLAPMATWT